MLSIVAEDRLRDSWRFDHAKVAKGNRGLSRLASLGRRTLSSSVQTVDGVSSYFEYRRDSLSEVGWHVCVFCAIFLVAFCSRATHELRLVVNSRVKVIEGISRTVTGC